MWNPVLLCILDQIITYNIVSNFQWYYLKWCQKWDEARKWGVLSVPGMIFHVHHVSLAMSTSKKINNESIYSTDLHCIYYLRRVFNKRFVSYVSKTSWVSGICGIVLRYFLEQRWLSMCVYNLRTQKLWNPVLLCILDQIITYNIVSNFQWSYFKWCQEKSRKWGVLSVPGMIFHVHHVSLAMSTSKKNKQWIHIFHWLSLHILFAKSFQQAICLLCFQNFLSKWYLWYSPWILSKATLIVYVCVIYEHKCCGIQFCYAFWTKLSHII